MDKLGPDDADADSGQDEAAVNRPAPGAFSAIEAAAALGVDELTVRRAINRGHLAATRRAGVCQISPGALVRYRTRQAVLRRRSHGHAPVLPEILTIPTPAVRPAGPDLGVGFVVPRALTSLIGRDREIAMITAALRREEVRLLTLTGPGGVGKTRLALASAAALAPEFADGVAFVPLAALTDVRLVLPALAQAIGVREVGDRLHLDGLRAYLRHRRMLLVLDNFEQVAAAAPVLADLLAAAPQLRMLVTSRARLRLAGEQVLPIPPLAVADHHPEPGSSSDQMTSPAVHLFVERARAVRPDFTLTAEHAPAISEICRRLDGLPLAIELAAARITHLSPAALLARLERRLPLLTGGPLDGPVRQHTMRDAIAWSYDLLSPEEQALLRQLAVFVGSFTLAAAEVVVVGPIPRSAATAEFAAPDPAGELSVLEGVASLVDKSLVQQDPTAPGESRFAMFETVREFGLERLSASGESSAVRARHAAWGLAAADHAWQSLWRQPLRLAVLDQIERDHDNLRAALSWYEQQADAVRCLRLAAALAPFWYFRSHRREGNAWFERGLALAANDSPPPELWVRVLHGRGLLADSRAVAIAAQEDALRRSRALGDDWSTAAALQSLGVLANSAGEHEQAARLSTEALAIFTPLGQRERISDLHCTLGRLAYAQGDLARAASELGQAFVIAREVDDAFALGQAGNALGLVLIGRGDLAAAAAMYHETLPTWLAVGSKSGLAHCLAGIAVLAAASRQPRLAARLAGVIAGLSEMVVHDPGRAERQLFERSERAVEMELGPVDFAAHRAAGRALRLEDGIGEATALVSALKAALTPSPGPGDSAGGGQPSAIARHGLTSRELEVLRLLSQRWTDREIATALFISPRTVARHLTAIFTKLDVANRREAAVAAARLGLD